MYAISKTTNIIVYETATFKSIMIAFVIKGLEPNETKQEAKKQTNKQLKKKQEKKMYAKQKQN